MNPMTPNPGWSDAQREFIRNLEEVGATRADRAVAIDRTMRLPPAELAALVDSGVVREAAANAYYVHQTQVPIATSPRDQRVAALKAAMEEESLKSELGKLQAARQPYDGRRVLKTLLFWLIVILIPIFLLQVCGTRG